VLIPAEALYAVVEVKSVLTQDELNSCVEAAKKVRSHGHSRQGFRLCVPRTPSLIDYVIESPNVGGDDRSVMLPPGPVRLAVQVEVPT